MFQILFIITQVLIIASKDSTEFCEQLTEKSLVIILGPAFNPRYMSFDSPWSIDSDMPLDGHKRSSAEISFYADGGTLSIGNSAAWETNRLEYFKDSDQGLSEHKPARSLYISKQELGRAPKVEMFKSRPWECTSVINWIDLGVQYFPRYVRSVECTAKRCWYGHFNCKPKSFTLKVLRRKEGTCIRVSNKLVMMTSTTYGKDYTELWIWEEIAINFCCDCVMVY